MIMIEKIIIINNSINKNNLDRQNIKNLNNQILVPLAYLHVINA
jgi:hypothetical protein